MNTTAQVGGAIGLAVLATLSTSHTESLLAEGRSAPAALTSGFHLAFGTGAALVAIAIVVAATVIRSLVKPQPATDTESSSPELAKISI